MRVYGVNPCIKYNTMFNARYDGRIQLAPHAEPLGNIREKPLEEILDPRDVRIFDYYVNGCRCSLTVSKAIEI